MLRQRSAACPPCLGPGAFQRRIGLLVLRFGFGDGLFEILQREIELVGIELLRAGAELPTSKLADQVAKTIVLAGKSGILGAPGSAFGPRFQEHDAKRRYVIGKRLGGRVHDRD